jgi:transcriptional regulator with XRE-family HTH domain
MTAYAKRVRTLREKSGKSAKEMCDLLGMSDMEYFDLELHDSELPMVPSLDQVRRLAAALGVTVGALLAEDGLAAPARRVEYRDLVEHAQRHLRETGLTQDQFEHQIGWTLDDFFASEQKALETYNVQFLKALCAGLGVFMAGGPPMTLPNNRLQATVGGLGVDMPARWACAHRA